MFWDRVFPTLRPTTRLVPRGVSAILMDLRSGAHLPVSPYYAFLLALCNGRFSAAQIRELAQSWQDVHRLSSDRLAAFLKNAEENYLILRSSPLAQPLPLPDPITFARGAYQPFRHPWETGEPYDQPAELDLYVSGRCNLDCEYCFVGSDGRTDQHDLTHAELCDVLEQAAALGVLRCTLTGGEPTLRRGWETLIERSHALGMYTVLATNGTRLTPPVIARLAEAGLGGLQISLDSLRPETFARNGGNPRDLATVVAAIELAARTPLHVSVKAVLTRHNAGEVAELIDRCAGLGVAALKLQNFEPGLAGRGDADLFLSDRQVEQIRQMVSVKQAALASPMRILLVITGEKWQAGEYRPCRHGLSGLGVLSNGDVTICDRFGHAPEMIIGNARRERLADIWKSPRHLSIVQPTGDQVLPPCSSCPHLSACRTGCFLYSLYAAGSPYAADPRCPRAQAADRPPGAACPGKIVTQGRYLFCPAGNSGPEDKPT